MLDFQSPDSYALLEPRIQRDTRYTTNRVTPTNSTGVHSVHIGNDLYRCHG